MDQRKKYRKVRRNCNLYVVLYLQMFSYFTNLILS